MNVIPFRKRLPMSCLKEMEGWHEKLSHLVNFAGVLEGMLTRYPHLQEQGKKVCAARSHLKEMALSCLSVKKSGDFRAYEEMKMVMDSVGRSGLLVEMLDLWEALRQRGLG